MATERLPAYVNKRKLASGKTGYYWVRPAWAKPPAIRNGRKCPFATTSLGADLADAIRKADAINDGFKQWRLGTESGPVKGTVRWLFRWYREQKRFKDLRAETRQSYQRMMDALEAIPMKTGTLGDRRAGAIDASAADRIYEKLRPGGERQAAYKMSTCRAVWGWAARHAATTGVKDNPFAGMKLRTKAEKGNVAATRAQYEAFKDAARAMGRQSLATAAAIAFEGCQRSYDCFGFEDPDGKIDRGVKWESYLPGESIGLVQSKTGNRVEIPLSDTIIVEVPVEVAEGEDPRVDRVRETVALYPELEAELALTPRLGGGIIVKDERTGEKYDRSYLQKLVRRVRAKAGLPAEITFTSFRHGGITEVGSVEADVRPISGHTTLDVTKIYNKATVEKARSIAAKRREHIALVTAGEEE